MDTPRSLQLLNSKHEQSTSRAYRLVEGRSSDTSIELEHALYRSPLKLIDENIVGDALRGAGGLVAGGIRGTAGLARDAARGTAKFGAGLAGSALRGTAGLAKDAIKGGFKMGTDAVRGFAKNQMAKGRERRAHGRATEKATTAFDRSVAKGDTAHTQAGARAQFGARTAAAAVAAANRQAGQRAQFGARTDAAAATAAHGRDLDKEWRGDERRAGRDPWGQQQQPSNQQQQQQQQTSNQQQQQQQQQQQPSNQQQQQQTSNQQQQQQQQPSNQQSPPIQPSHTPPPDPSDGSPPPPDPSDGSPPAPDPSGGWRQHPAPDDLRGGGTPPGGSPPVAPPVAEDPLKKVTKRPGGTPDKVSAPDDPDPTGQLPLVPDSPAAAQQAADAQAALTGPSTGPSATTNPAKAPPPEDPWSDYHAWQSSRASGARGSQPGVDQQTLSDVAGQHVRAAGGVRGFGRAGHSDTGAAAGARAMTRSPLRGGGGKTVAPQADAAGQGGTGVGSRGGPGKQRIAKDAETPEGMKVTSGPRSSDDQTKTIAPKSGGGKKKTSGPKRESKPLRGRRKKTAAPVDTRTPDERPSWAASMKAKREEPKEFEW